MTKNKGWTVASMPPGHPSGPIINHLKNILSRGREGVSGVVMRPGMTMESHAWKMWLDFQERYGMPHMWPGVADWPGDIVAYAKQQYYMVFYGIRKESRLLRSYNPSDSLAYYYPVEIPGIGRV